MTARVSKIGRTAAIGAFILCIACVGPAAAATDEQCRDILNQALTDKNPDTRKQAVVALSLVGTQYLGTLRDMLQDKELDVRLAAVASLAEVRKPEAIRVLHDALNGETPEVSFAAAKALWGL